MIIISCSMRAGEGPYLKIFAKNGQLLSRDEVLPFRVVHGIRPLKSDGEVINLAAQYSLISGFFINSVPCIWAKGISNLADNEERD